MPFLAPLVPFLVGTAATYTTGIGVGAAATTGLIGAGGQVIAAQTLTVGAMGMTGIGTMMQMSGARQAARSEAAIYRYNAEVARREAQQQQRASLEEQQVQREDMRRTLKRQRALYAKGKIMMTGSPLEVQLATVEVMATDIAMLAQERQFAAGRFRTRAGLERFKARDVERAGRLAVGTALVGGVSDISKMGISYMLNR